MIKPISFLGTGKRINPNMTFKARLNKLTHLNIERLKKQQKKLSTASNIAKQPLANHLEAKAVMINSQLKRIEKKRVLSTQTAR